jgi:hypothetical protein
MDISSSAIAQILRTQAWERAKGELRSMLHTFYNVNSSGGFVDHFDELDKEVQSFIQRVEDNGLFE